MAALLITRQVVGNVKVYIFLVNKFILDHRGRQGQARNLDLELWSGLGYQLDYHYHSDFIMFFLNIVDLHGWWTGDDSGLYQLNHLYDFSDSPGQLLFSNFIWSGLQLGLGLGLANFFGNLYFLITGVFVAVRQEAVEAGKNEL